MSGRGGSGVLLSPVLANSRRLTCANGWKSDVQVRPHRRREGADGRSTRLQYQACFREHFRRIAEIRADRRAMRARRRTLRQEMAARGRRTLRTLEGVADMRRASSGDVDRIDVVGPVTTQAAPRESRCRCRGPGWLSKAGRWSRMARSIGEAELST